MAVNGINQGNPYVSQVQPQPQTHAERVNENEKVLKEVSGAVPALQAEAKPTVNTQGQKVGSIISTQA